MSHRDIKPENMILTSDGGLKLVDLGVARLPHLDTAREVDHVPGTASYRAPEMFDGNRGAEQTDIFALGVTLYRMFSGGSYPYGEIEPFIRPRQGKAEPGKAVAGDFAVAVRVVDGCGVGAVLTFCEWPRLR
jgi:serine/threonine protein kinase